jgi:hypothetical protein
MAEEVALAFAWLTSTLAGDAALQGYAPGGVSRTFAQPNTLTPYVVMQYQNNGSDNLVFGGANAFSDLPFEVIAVGPAKNTQALTQAAARIKQLLTITQPISVTGGTIISSYRTQPMESDSLVDGESWTSLGGTYLVRAQAS